MSVQAPTSRRAASSRRATGGLRRAALAGGLGAVLVLAVAFVFGGSADRLAGGTRIAGVDVGGLPEAQATALLERRAEAVEQVPVTFVAGTRTWRLAPTQLGVQVDWDEAVRAAAADGDSLRPVRGLRRLRTRLFGAEVAPQAASFETVVAYQVGAMARAVDRPAREPSLRRSGLRVAILPGREGVKLDRSAAAAAVVSALAAFERGAPVELPTVVDRPRLSVASLEPAAERARLALSAPVSLVLGQTRWRVPRWEIARFLRLPAGGVDQLAIAGGGADRWIARLQDRVNRPPRDATFRVRPGGIEVVPAAAGRVLDVGATVDALLRAVTSAERRLVALPVRTAAPERTTAEAQKMGITGVVGSYTTTYGGTEGRLANVRLVAELIDGTLVGPGETFSFNGTTGERNAEKGFRAAPVIINGELQDGIGGGVCQVSTTLFNAAFEAGLPIDARTNHALYISHYPLGRDATVNYPDIDLRFTNDTEKWLLVRTFVGAGSLTVNLYGTSPGRRVETESAPLTVTGKVPVERTEDPALPKGERVIEQVGQPPRETQVLRRVYDRDGTLLFENTWTSSYRGEPTLVRVGTKPRPRPAPDASAPQVGPEAPGKPGTSPKAGPATAAPVAPART